MPAAWRSALRAPDQRSSRARARPGRRRRHGGPRCDRPRLALRVALAAQWATATADRVTRDPGRPALRPYRATVRGRVDPCPVRRRVRRPYQAARTHRASPETGRVPASARPRPGPGAGQHGPGPEGLEVVSGSNGHPGSSPSHAYAASCDADSQAR
ncbi:DUF6207 family protein [Streptomyces sp. NPDC054813]